MVKSIFFRLAFVVISTASCGFLLSSKRDGCEISVARKSTGYPLFRDSLNVVRDLYNRLSSLKDLQYHYELIFNYSSQRRTGTRSADVYLVVPSHKGAFPVNFSCETNDELAVYNGSEFFRCDKVANSMTFEWPDERKLEWMPYFHLSYVTLLNFIPNLLNASIPYTVTDSTCNNIPCHSLKFSLNNRRLKANGKYFDMSIPIRFNYTVLIEKSSFLPVQIQERINNSNDFIKSSFQNVDTNPPRKDSRFWLYSTYSGKYKLRIPQFDSRSLVRVGDIVPPWNLPEIGSKDGRGKVHGHSKLQLIEFWISNCGYCIEAVPKLNLLAKKFDSASLNIVGINVGDSLWRAEMFNTNHKPLYINFADGAEFAKKIGVTYFPTIILLNSERSVLYAGPFNYQKIESLVGQSLN